ncbi:hypothetical protein Unana1_05725 [Umbelopsis nana]
MAQFTHSIQPLGSAQNISPWNSAEHLPTPPVLPWVSSAEPATASMRNSVDTSSLHVVKRYNATTDDQTKVKKKARWTVHKWWMLVSNTFLFIYGLGGVLLAVLTYFKLYLRADVIIVSESLLLRCYVSYRKQKWNLEGKLSYQWHYTLSAEERARIQANLHCCGYKSFTDFHERSNKCFPRTLLPGCKFKYQTFSRQCLVNCYIVAFSLVPFHLFVIISALLCSNHINRKFGKGLPPKIYRLDYQGLVAGTPTGSSVNVSRLERKRIVSHNSS